MFAYMGVRTILNYLLSYDVRVNKSPGGEGTGEADDRRIFMESYPEFGMCGYADVLSGVPMNY